MSYLPSFFVIIGMPDTYSSGVIYPFGGAFLMSLMGSVIRIFFLVLLSRGFGELTITIGADSSDVVCSMDGSVTLRIAASSLPLELVISHCCTFYATV